jgi:hypothetical protein
VQPSLRAATRTLGGTLCLKVTLSSCRRWMMKTKF